MNDNAFKNNWQVCKVFNAVIFSFIKLIEMLSASTRFDGIPLKVLKSTLATPKLAPLGALYWNFLMSTLAQNRWPPPPEYTLEEPFGKNAKMKPWMSESSEYT